MTRLLAIAARRSVVARRGAVTLHRTIALTSVAMAALLLGGCDDTTPDTGLAPTAPSAMRADDDASHSGRRHGDLEGVTAVATAWDAAWNAGDANAIGALFTDDAELVNGRGQVAVGANAILAQHAALFAGPFLGSHIQGTVRRITFLSPTSAVLDIDSQLTGYKYLPPGTVPSLPGMQRGRHKRVLVKRGGQWKIALMQITLIAPAP